MQADRQNRHVEVEQEDALPGTLEVRVIDQNSQLQGAALRDGEAPVENQPCGWEHTDDSLIAAGLGRLLYATVGFLPATCLACTPMCANTDFHTYAVWITDLAGGVKLEPLFKCWPCAELEAKRTLHSWEVTCTYVCTCVVGCLCVLCIGSTCVHVYMEYVCVGYRHTQDKDLPPLRPWEDYTGLHSSRAWSLHVSVPAICHGYGPSFAETEG